MAVKNITTLNNNDGFTARQTTVLNRVLVSERNRWSKKSKQKIVSPSISDTLESASGVSSVRQTQSFNKVVSLQFYLNDVLLKKDVELEILSLRKKILSYQLSGNMYNPGSEEGDISKFILFRVENNKVYATSLNDGDVYFPHIFLVNLTLEVE